MRLPLPTIVLFAAVAGAYFYLSGGQLFMSDDVLGTYALQPSQPASFFSYGFVHVGVLHLAGNLVPFLAFAFLAEAVIGAQLFLVFLLAGVVGGAAFLLFSPGVALVGASAGISGLLGVAFSARPKASAVALLAMPFAVYLLVFPAANALISSQQNFFFERQAFFSEQSEEFEAQNKAVEATVAAEKAAEAQAHAERLSSGESREKSTQTDALVHFVGVIVGFFYVFAFHHEKFVQGATDVRESVLCLQQRLRRP